MSNTFSKTLVYTLKVMQDMRVQVDVRDSVLKSLGIESLIPDIFKKKRKWTKQILNLYSPISYLSENKLTLFSMSENNI